MIGSAFNMGETAREMCRCHVTPTEAGGEGMDSMRASGAGG